MDDEEVYRRDGLTTRTQISLADSFQVDAPPGRVRLHVEVPSQGIRETFEVDLSEQPFVGLSLRDGRLDVRFPERLGSL